MENVRTFVKRFFGTERALVKHVLDELRLGYPLRDAPVLIDVVGGLRWDIPHPDTVQDWFQIDDRGAPGDIDPLAMCVFGWIELWYAEGASFPAACFVCDGLREARPEFR